MSDTPDRSTSSSETAFGRLWMARDVATLGEWILFVAFLAHISSFTDSPRTIALLVAASALPVFLLTPIVARFVTWRNARVLGIGAQLLRTAVLLPLFQVEQQAGTDPIVQAAFLAAITVPVFAASSARLLGTAVNIAAREATTRVLHNTSLLAATVGPAFGFVLFGVAGFKTPLIASILAALLSAGFLLFVKTGRPAAGDAPMPLASLPSFGPLPTSIVDAFRTPALRPVAAIQFLTALFAGGLTVAQANFMTTGLMVGGENIAVILAGQGLGMLVGSFGYYRLGTAYSLNTLAATGLALIGGGEFGLAVSSSLPAGTALAAVIGAGIGLFTASVGEQGPRLLNGTKAQSPRPGMWMAVHGAALLSILAAAPLCESISARFTLVLSGILVSTLALFAFGMIPEGLRSAQRVDNSPTVRATGESPLTAERD